MSTYPRRGEPPPLRLLLLAHLWALLYSSLALLMLGWVIVERCNLRQVPGWLDLTILGLAATIAYGIGARANLWAYGIGVPCRPQPREEVSIDS